MLSWFAEEDDFTPPDAPAWTRLRDLFDEEPDGYLRFRRSLLRDSAYQGLPFKLRRKLHAAVATRLRAESDYPEEAASTLSLHYFEAGDYRLAWNFAYIAARRADEVYAYVEAARLYDRALEAARNLRDIGSADLAEVHEALGESWYQAGEFRKASEAFTAARPLVTNDPLADARIMLKLAHLEEKLGKYADALRWTEQARSVLVTLQGPQAARQTARATAYHAIVLQAEGRASEALEWAERAAADAEAADDPEAIGDACFVMGWAHGELGKPGALDLMQRSLQGYERAGNVVRRAGVLMTLGVICQWEGHWDDALTYYERGRDEGQKIGDTITAALAKVNIAEILIDRGEWKEAESLLLETLPVWKASQYRYYLAACLSQLGRAWLRLGRIDDALARFDEAKANFVHVGAEEMVPPIDAWIAECRIAQADADTALRIVRGMLGRASTSNGVARVVPLLERLQAHALMLQGDLWSARDALEASLAAARERNDLLEATLTSLSLIELDRLEGVEPPLEMVNESRSFFAAFKVRAVPPVPRPL
jgi:tetratricopeptide (TPR) repeat protein